MSQLSSSPRELIVIANPDAGLQATAEGFLSSTATLVSPLEKILQPHGATFKPLFGISEALLRVRTPQRFDEAVGPSLHPALFYRVIAKDSSLESLAEQLRAFPAVRSAFIKPGAELPLIDPDMKIPQAPGLAHSCNFTAFQTYRGTAPDGIDSDYASTVSGGGGSGVNIIDIEKAWCFSHVDLKENLGGLIGGVASLDPELRHHGTAVLGVLGGDRNDFGITGICPEASVRTISVLGHNTPGCTSDWGSAAAIRLAADLLSPGDIMVLELHNPGPLSNFQPRPDQYGYIPVEWWPDNMAAIGYATSLGIIVVEAAGNGGVNLNDPVYDSNPQFPSDWHNPFRRTTIDPGAIVVGAGAPPLGTNGSNRGPDRSRLAFSNFGDMLDAQGWGYEVTTSGFGDQRCGLDEELKYTRVFRGTSSATPIIAGAVACIQGILKAAGRNPLRPHEARKLLRATGSPQTAGLGRPITQRIGNRPDLRQMISEFGLKP